MHKHHRVYLPYSSPALEANLDELSLQGWEFVAWIDDWCDWSQMPGEKMQRQALLRQPYRD